MRAVTTGSVTTTHTEASVDITVVDVNDCAPKFERENYVATVLENTAIGTEIVKVSNQMSNLETASCSQGSFECGKLKVTKSYFLLSVEVL